MSRTVGAKNRKDVSIVLCAQAGMGVQTVERFLTYILKHWGFNVFATKEYMSRIRGGMNSVSIRVSSQPVQAGVSRIDILLPLDENAVRHVSRRISPRTTILAESFSRDFDTSRCNCIEVPLTRIASDIGNKTFSNIVAVGMITGLFGVQLQAINEHIGKYFAAKSQEIIDGNLKAIQAGYKIGRELADSGKITIEIERDPQLQEQILLSGAEAVALGAIAGGCNFVSSYPMSPSTGVLVFLAQHAKEFGIVAEQAEDEIAAINMAVGASYAGARAMVTTSGGGFALMTEGLSLSAMLEVPVVVHLAQRPGPATGLPTRTEQADLELALYAGHGEFPRIILTPGTLEQAFYLTQRAFNLADRYQVPVFVLTDQYLIDSYYNTDDFDLSEVKVQSHIIKTPKNYERYELTDDGISPRGIPGYGKCLVCVDSDEHDTQGHITENLELRARMVEKRLKKGQSLRAETVESWLSGPEDYKTLVMCWGSTCNIVDEAIHNMGRDDVAMLHFRQVHPLPESTAAYLEKAGRTIIVEGNAIGQLARQIELYTGARIEEKVLKYDGLSFTVEQIVEELVRRIG